MEEEYEILAYVYFSVSIIILGIGLIVATILEFT